MNNKGKICILLFALLALPLTTSGGVLQRYCFQEPNGTFYDLRGGNPGKKAFTIEASNIFCPATPLTGIATFAQLSDGGYLVTMLISSDPAGVCVSYVVVGIVNPFLLGIHTGSYDNLPRNFPPDGPFSANRVACPGPLSPVKPTGKPRPDPGPGKASQ